MIIDADFPGGNIVVERVAGDAVFLRPDLRDTSIEWFYWHFRVREAGKRTVVFHFTGPRLKDGVPWIMDVHGPAVSVDGGRTWRWFGREVVDGLSFRHRFSAEHPETRFCFGIPYLEADFHRFLDPHRPNPHLKIEALCQTRKGRTVELLRLGQTESARPPEHRVLLTARHHACEGLASFVLEGMMAEILAGNASGPWFREQVETVVIPFLDKDGVEEGDQGKCRAPYDHDADFVGGNRYESVRALRDFTGRWADGRLRVAMSLHDPDIGDHAIFLVGAGSARNWTELRRFSNILREVQSGPLVFDPRDDIPWGQGWNSESGGQHTTFNRWASELPGIDLGAILEIPYANVKGRMVTVDAARDFGRDVLRALQRYLSETHAIQPRF